MNPIEFEGQNCVFAKDQPEYLPLPALVVENQTITCWELSAAEVEALRFSKKIWLSQMNFGQPLQPQRPSIERPFELEVIDPTSAA